VRLVFAVYDVLPLKQPQLFPPEIERMVRRWLETLSESADGLVCISRTVADEVLEWLSTVKRKKVRALRVGFFHLGADLAASLPTRGVSEESGPLVNSIRRRPTFLMVGTVEPRKGHRQALAAMERLWAQGVDANLVIVGKKGWMMDDLADRIEQYPEYNNRLIWLQSISDETLEEVYRSARALLVASEGEGFGLPLVEAAKHGLPIIARDIPVFREVAGENAHYFSGHDAQTLADALAGWLALGNSVPRSSDIRWLTWDQSSRELLDVILANNWYRSWPDRSTHLRSTTTSGSQNDGPNSSRDFPTNITSPE
jgi:glycosyltransferase involved in cell wall biosynthesis